MPLTWQLWASPAPIQITDTTLQGADVHNYARNANTAAPQTWAPPFTDSGIDSQLFPAVVEEFAGDNPSYSQDIKGAEEAAWRAAMDAEMDHLETHWAYEELPEDALASWDATKRRSFEVLQTLWVLKRKRGANNQGT